MKGKQVDTRVYTHYVNACMSSRCSWNSYIMPVLYITMFPYNNPTGQLIKTIWFFIFLSCEMHIFSHSSLLAGSDNKHIHSPQIILSHQHFLSFLIFICPAANLEITGRARHPIPQCDFKMIHQSATVIRTKTHVSSRLHYNTLKSACK